MAARVMPLGHERLDLLGVAMGFWEYLHKDWSGEKNDLQQVSSFTSLFL
jgi:hypothetical protein